MFDLEFNIFHLEHNIVTVFEHFVFCFTFRDQNS